MSERIFSFLLQLYPRDFREQYGAEMLQLFRDRLASEPSRLGLWFDILADLARSLPREHFRPSTNGIYRVPRWIHVRGMLALFLLTELAFLLASLTGPLSRVSNFVEGLFFCLAIGSPFPLIGAFKRKPLEYTVDPDGIRFGNTSIRPVEIARIVEEPGQAIVVFGTNGAQILVPTHVSSYKTLRAQLAAWAPIDHLPDRRILGSALYIAWVTVIASSNLVLVPLGSAILAAITLYFTLHPNARVQDPQATSRARWGNCAVACTVLILKIFLSRL